MKTNKKVDALMTFLFSQAITFAKTLQNNGPVKISQETISRNATVTWT